MEYSLEKICSTTGNSIRGEWARQLGLLGDEGKVWLSDVERIASWCEKQADVCNVNDHMNLMALCEVGKAAPRAILEITDASKSKDPAYKLLNIYLEPDLTLDHKDVVRREDLLEITAVFGFAFAESLNMAVKNSTEKLKLFGRSTEMLSMFDRLVETAERSGPVNIYRQGKWLVIEIKGVNV